VFGVIQRKPCFKTFNGLVGNIELGPNSTGLNIVPHKDVGWLGVDRPRDVLATLMCKMGVTSIRVMQLKSQDQY